MLLAQTLLDDRPRLLTHRDGNFQPSARAEPAQDLCLDAMGFVSGVANHGS